MARILFKLRDVPDDEAEEIRDLLSGNAIDCYETSGGNWGMSMPAIWVRDEAQFGKARSLIEDYQQQRQARIRAEFEGQRRTGEAETHLQRVLRRPLTVIVLLLVAVFVMYFSVSPYLQF